MIRYEIHMNTLSIPESYKIHKKSDMNDALNEIRHDNEAAHYNILKRTNKNMIREWRSHNLLYDLNIARRRTAQVDFEYPQKWYYKLAYGILSLFYWKK